MIAGRKTLWHRRCTFDALEACLQRCSGARMLKWHGVAYVYFGFLQDINFAMHIPDCSQVCSRIVRYRATTEGGIYSACVLRSISPIRQPTWPRSLTISSLFTPWDRVALHVGCIRVWNWAERALQLVLIKRSLTSVGRVRHPDHRRITGTHVCMRANLLWIGFIIWRIFY